jgi:hypothetical protein
VGRTCGTNGREEERVWDIGRKLGVVDCIGLAQDR